MKSIRSMQPGERRDTFHMGDGYEWAGMLAQEPHFKAVPSWGLDGWDLGDWPLVVVGHYDDGEAFALITRCEGDVTIERFASRAELYAATDSAAEYYWRANENGPAPDRKPEDRRGPFSWDRLNASAAA